jgi:hypothetical protein
MNIGIQDICNLSRIPICMEKNPLYLTSVQILNNKNIKPEDTYLYNFRKQFNPKTLGQLFGIKNSSFPILDHSYKTVFLPWIHHTPVNVPDVAFIKFNILQKVLILKQLISSILKHGYIPEKFPTRQGGICGYFLQYKKQNKFYITAGNHRVAVLSALYKDKNIPVIFENKSFLKEKELRGRGPILNTYSSEDIDNWPSIQHNTIQKECALQIIASYFNN